MGGVELSPGFSQSMVSSLAKSLEVLPDTLGFFGVLVIHGELFFFPTSLLSTMVFKLGKPTNLLWYQPGNGSGGMPVNGIQRRSLWRDACADLVRL